MFNPIPTGLCHVITVYGLIQPMAGRNRVKLQISSIFNFDWAHQSWISDVLGVKSMDSFLVDSILVRFLWYVHYVGDFKSPTCPDFLGGKYFLPQRMSGIGRAFEIANRMNISPNHRLNSTYQVHQISMLIRHPCRQVQTQVREGICLLMSVTSWTLLDGS